MTAGASKVVTSIPLTAFPILEYASDERFTGYLDSAGGGAVVLIDGLFSIPPGEWTISMTGKANRS
jgi:hypothetical protein